ncbi:MULTISPECIES: phosphoglycerate dehydrogenase [Clostridium]|uniref:phosphoglycerate dehydrogenase n=1 Tax=Clostridium TaxID=1485 RepID=UPI00069E84EA|nr:MULTISPECIES: phosphoglycerate dehydrogenase [Clostridium]KOF57074.1 dihydrofolate reductase [Clostridium sp. DMHC 10]MCD2348940.1 phosphoglycerate dehydrogenase [Clostridium guangxiense]
MKIKALFTNDFEKDKIDKLKDLGYEIIINKDHEIKYSDELKDIEMLFTYDAFKSLDISKMKSLKWIQLASDGIDHVPKEKLRGTSITLTNNKDSYSIPISEWIVSAILDILKQSYSFYRNKEKKLWKLNFSLKELYKSTVGIIGTGSIAIETAKRLKGFDVEVLGLNTNGRDVFYFDKCYSNVEIQVMLKKCDIVICLLPLTKNTVHFIGEKEFSFMKEGVVFVNASRGEVVDEKRLIENIENKKIGGAALDVFEKEPLEEENPLWDFENVIVTPHNSWTSQNRDNRLYELIYDNMVKYKNGEGLSNIVNIERGY